MNFAVKTQTPVASTLLGLGAFPASHDLSLGMMGMHGEVHTNLAIQNSDLILAFGMRFDDRVTGTLKTYAPRAKKIHIEIDPSEVHKNVAVDVPLVGDLKTVLTDLVPLVDEYDHDEWLKEIRDWKAEADSRSIMNWPNDDKLYVPHLIADIWKATGGNAIMTTDVGQHQMWTAQYYALDKPNRWLTSGGAGTMGFGLPSAIGAWFAHKDQEIWAIAGDGGFQMTAAELTTAVQEGANVKVAIMNNNFLGMVRQWQELFFENRESGVDLEGNPDFAKLADAYPGAKGFTLKRAADIRKILKRAMDYNEGPCVINAEVEKGDNVYPMIPAGRPLEDMILEAPKYKMDKPTGST